MIRNVTDLIRNLQEGEIAQIEKFGIKHAPTIGEMYEGLTAKVVNTLIPDKANLRVVSGFIKDGRGNQSGQIDCMLVSGSGQRIPNTKHFLWHVKDVIAVLEVKKKLFSAELADSHEHLRKVLYLHGDYLQRGEGRHKSYDIEPSLYAFGQITGQIPPDHENADKLPLHLEMIYHSLIIEQVSPIRIVFGYSGYRYEASLRKGFAKFLSEHLLEHGYGGASFPNLIVCGTNSLVKLNGHPYLAPLKGDDWLVFASSTENPLIFLLELIWTRLSYKLNMPAWFDNDLSLEAFSPLLWGRVIRHNGKTGWAYTLQQSPARKLKQKPIGTAEWAPHFVSLYQFILINALCREGSVLISSPFVKGSSSKQEKADFEDLLAKRLIARDGDKILLLTRQCRCVIMPKGGICGWR